MAFPAPDGRAADRVVRAVPAVGREALASLDPAIGQEVPVARVVRVVREHGQAVRAVRPARPLPALRVVLAVGQAVLQVQAGRAGQARVKGQATTRAVRAAPLRNHPATPMRAV